MANQDVRERAGVQAIGDVTGTGLVATGAYMISQGETLTGAVLIVCGLAVSFIRHT